MERIGTSVWRGLDTIDPPTRDSRWENVFGHVKRAGKFVNMYVEVTNSDGFKIFRSKTLPLARVESSRVDLIKWCLDGMVREIEMQMNGVR